MGTRRYDPAPASDPRPIVTERLRLEPVAPETLEAFLADDHHGAESAQKRALPDDLFSPEDDYFFRIQLDQMRSKPSGRAWCARVVVRRRDGAVIGHCGFHGPPTDVGRAEIGYMVLPRYRGRGYATEAARGLVDFARRKGESVVFASVAPDNVASLAVVAKLGFRRTGVQIDDIDGEEWVFELEL